MNGQPSSLREINRRAVFDHVRHHGGASRAGLAKTVGLSPPTVGKIADELLGLGLLEEGDGEHADSPGRPARELRLNQSRSVVVAVQIGVRRTRLAALPVAGPVGERWPIDFATPKTPRTWIKRFKEAAGALKSARPGAVAVSLPGLVDEAAGRVLLSPNLHWLEDIMLGDLVGGVFRAPICAVHEIRALALGHLECEPTPGDFLLVDIGAGVGGAAVIGGRLLPAALPLAGELGHTPVAGNQRLCGCGGIGCVETLLSRDGLLRTWGESDGPKRPTWNGLMRHVADVGVEPWLAGTLDAAAVSIAGAINVLGVRNVIVTGALVELPDSVMAHLTKAVERSAMWARFGEVVVRGAPRRRAAGLIAAAIDRVLLPREDQRVSRSVHTRRTG